jgi:hypothetical protein
MIRMRAGKRPPTELSIRLRWAFPDDDVTIARLAALDSAAVPAPPLLLAEVDGHPRAALSLASGELIADPFQPTAALGELLRLRARQLHAAAEATRATSVHCSKRAMPEPRSLG